MCVNLCTTCAQNDSDERCLKSDSFCMCNQILDSLNKVKQERIQEQTTLIKSLSENCETTFCTKEIFYKDGKFSQNVNDSKTDLSAEELINFAQTNNIALTHSNENNSDSTEQVEISNEMDSLSQFNNMFSVLENGKIIADTLKKICSDSSECVVKITYVKSNLMLASVNKLDKIIENNEQNKDSLVVTISPEVSENLKEEKDSIIVDSIQVDSSKIDKETKKKRPIFYNGIEFALGSFREESRINSNVSDMGFELYIAYILRWYLYSGGNIQLGIGLSNHFMDSLDVRGYDYKLDKALDVKMNYYNLSLEIPLQLRLGFAIGSKKNFAPFISYKFSYRRPIFYTAKLIASHYGEEFKESDKIDVYGEDDNEFNMWFGTGLQITRGLIIGMEWLVYSNADGYAHIYDSGFRLKVEVAW